MSGQDPGAAEQQGSGDVPSSADGPGTAGETGVQRALGERRRRRLAERSGRVDLDATMSGWPVVDPPSTPRPVVRPARPTVAGAATAPVLPPPGALVVGPLLEQRRAAAAGLGAGDTEARRRRRSHGSPVAPPQAEVPAASGGAPGPGGTPGPGAPLATARSNPAVADAAEGRGDLDREADLVRTAAGRRRPSRPPAGAGTGSTRDVARAASEAVGANPRPTPAPTTGSLLPSQPVTTATGGGGSLTARLRALRLPRRGNGLLLVAAALALVLLLVAGFMALPGGGEDPSQAVAPVEGPPAQQTLGLTVEGDDGVVGGLVLGVDSARVSTVLLPSDLLLEVADASQQPLGRAVSLGADPVRRGLEDTLLLRVDGVVLLDDGQLASLVDASGGVVVDVAAEVVSEDVVVAAGPDQRLTGAQAVAYATLRVDGEPVEAGLARLGAVVDGLLAALPEDPATVQEAVAEAGLTPSTGMDEAQLAEVLAESAARAGDGSTQSVVLPTRELTAGGAVRRGVDDEAAQEELSGRFAGAALPVAAVGEVRVVVRNGVGTPGLVGAARDRLVDAGLRYTGGGNTTQFGQAETMVLVASQDEQDRDRGQAVALALGVDAALQVNSESMVDTDVVVVLGEDFARLAAEEQPSDPPTTGDAP